MLRFRVALAVGLVVGVGAAVGRAHEIKVLVSRMVTAPGGSDTVYISWGHVLPVDAPIEADAIEDYELRSPSGSVQYLTKEGLSLHANEVHVEEEGVYQAVATRKPSVFTVVVDEEGNHRHQAGPKTSVTEGRIDSATRSHQFAKALLVSGSAEDAPTQPLGHAIEIVPQDGPEAWRSGQDLHFRVVFRGKPLTGQDVVARFIGFKPDNAWCYATTTNPEGVATIRVTQPGVWIVRARVQQPATGQTTDLYDFESYTATLALEVRP